MIFEVNIHFASMLFRILGRCDNGTALLWTWSENSENVDRVVIWAVDRLSSRGPFPSLE